MKTEKHVEFHKTMKDTSLKVEFYEAIKKNPEDLNEIDRLSIIKRMGQLSDDERYKFRHILVIENLTPEEKKRYENIYPERTGGGLFKMYFPKMKDVEEHYKINFTEGRTGGV